MFSLTYICVQHPTSYRHDTGRKNLHLKVSCYSNIYLFIYFGRIRTVAFIKISQGRQRVHYIGVVEYHPYHTDKPLICLCMSNYLQTTLLPVLRTLEKAIHLPVTRADLADSRRWPKEDREASLLRGEFITTSESQIGRASCRERV